MSFPVLLPGGYEYTREKARGVMDKLSTPQAMDDDEAALYRNIKQQL